MPTRRLDASALILAKDGTLAMRAPSTRSALFWLLFLLASPDLVHGALISPATAAGGKQKSKAAGQAEPRRSDEIVLPAPVTDMREAILAAVASGDIEEMRTALDWNELKPVVADEPVADPIAYWRALSIDGQGHEILAVLGDILAQPHAVLPVGRDPENNRLYVWPRFAEVPGTALTPAEREAMQRIVPPLVLAEMARTGRYLWWRLAIGADGTWHAFVRAK